MTALEQLILQSANPFGRVVANNPWSEPVNNFHVNSIHQQEFQQIEASLDLVLTQDQSQTVILLGDSGSGKTHFINRIKKESGDRAVFAYIEPFPDSNSIWRHILRYTVDSLLQPANRGGKSQLITWLESCLAAIETNLSQEQKTLINSLKNVFSGRDGANKLNRLAFINILRGSFPQDIYNASEFFGVLYALLDPELSFIASDWLKGDAIDDESMELLKVKTLVDDEQKAQYILKNLSKISQHTVPLIICFDQLENIANLPSDRIDLQSLFNVNSTIKNGGWSGLLIVISLIESIWRDNRPYINQQDLILGRVDAEVRLKPISLEVGEQLYQSRLSSFYELASKIQTSFNLVVRADLDREFPGGYATPRSILDFARRKFDEWKSKISPEVINPVNLVAEFQLLWEQQLKQTREKCQRLHQYSATELIKMLHEALVALGINSTVKLLTDKYAPESLSYRSPNNSLIGAIWNEDKNLNSFCAIMKSCQELFKKGKCEQLYLIRAQSLGKETNKGYKIYQAVFGQGSNKHIEPDLHSVQILSSYHQLVNSVAAGELFISGETIDRKQLHDLAQKANIFAECTLLASMLQEAAVEPQPVTIQECKEYIRKLVAANWILKKDVVVENAIAQYPNNTKNIELALQQLHVEKAIKVTKSELVCILKAK